MPRIFPSIALIFTLLLALALASCSGDSNDRSDRKGSSCTEVGAANCACTPDNTCNLGLSCVSGVCIDPNAPNDAGYNDASLKPPDCVELVPLRQWESDPSAVAMLFTAEDCETGEAFADFNEAAFAIEEDGRPLSSEAVPRILPSQGLRVYVTLMLDMSGSTLPNLAELQAGARQFIDEILVEQALDNVYISLQAFDGSPTPVMLENPSRDAQKLKASIDALTDFKGPDLSSTNLYGATRQGVQNLQVHQQRVMDLNYDGVATSGYLVIFSASGDTAGREDANAARDTVASARAYNPQADTTPTVSTLAVGLRGNDYNPEAIKELVGDTRLVAEADLSELSATFARVGRQIGRRIKGTYLLAYCSASRAGDHTVTLKMAAGESNRLSFEFNSDRFGGGCSAQFFETACEVRSCGGFNCGACEDESEYCNSRESGQCINHCIKQDMCSGERITNELGYEQVCSLGEDIRQCLGRCVDTLAHDNHCGGCNIRCQTLDGSGEQCVQGECVCEGGGSVCNGTCQPPSFFESDDANCGRCGHSCTDGTICSGGACVCPQGSEFCDGACRTPDYFESSAMSCRTCGNVCGVSCTDSECLNATQITVGESNTCALLGDETVRCWGENYFGQLGDGTTTERLTPVAVSGLSGVTQITTGSSHTCALLADGTVRCWGYNDEGQLGDGTRASSRTPVAVSGLSGVTQITAGNWHTCALLEDSTVRCWGYNWNAQLGDGTITNSRTPVAVSGLSGVTQITAGNWYTCALLGDGTVRCWGDNYYGQLGDGTTTMRRTPVSVSGLSGVTQITIRGEHTCALLSDETVRCWGYNAAGQLGDGTTTDRHTPVPVSGLSGVTQLTAGNWHTCALLSDETVRCWGVNSYGQLGDGTTTNRHTPVSVSGLSGATQIAPGGRHTCALHGKGMASCWGSNGGGPLGDGTETDRHTPTPVTW